MIRKLHIAAAALAGLFSLSSCEKVIDLDLNEAEKKYVIEAMITDQPGTARVLVSQTKNFDEDNSFTGVAGAEVTITESGGPTTTLSSVQPGIYEAPALTGTSGKTYTLSVRAGTLVFSGVSVMPRKVNLDTIFTTDELLFADTRKIVNAVFHDPAGAGDNYRFVQYVNGLKEDQVMIRNDEYSDGRQIVNKLFYFTDDEDDERNIRSGDQVTIGMMCIDPAIYKYWFSLDRSATGGSGQATPSNPVTNLQGGALGYFSAHTLQSRTMVVP
ncbi:MAG: DUF4249 domain-containing protein [Chitinophagaceae bacterium]